MPSTKPVATIALARIPSRHQRLQFYQCPWSAAYADPQIGAWLSAYARLERWGEWPPGRRDPRLAQALAILGNEHAALELEELETLRRQVGNGPAS